MASVIAPPTGLVDQNYFYKIYFQDRSTSVTRAIEPTKAKRV